MPNDNLQGQTLKEAGWELEHEKEVGLGIVGRRRELEEFQDETRWVNIFLFTFIFSLSSESYKAKKETGLKIEEKYIESRQKNLCWPASNALIWGRPLMLKDPKVLKNGFLDVWTQDPHPAHCPYVVPQIQAVGICSESSYKRRNIPCLQLNGRFLES